MTWSRETAGGSVQYTKKQEQINNNVIHIIYKEILLIQRIVDLIHGGS